MKNMNEEFIGQVEKVYPEEGHGFISSLCLQENIYFELKGILKNLNETDSVAFIIERHNKNMKANLVRKVYTNDSGIKFVSRVDNTHNHVDLDKFMPLIGNFIKDYNEDFIEKEFTFDFVIGTTECIQTDISDEIMQ
ncbi:cold shock CspA family protein [Flavobacterium sp. 28A]|uniref:hypothetical protein n=1 Tax=Flavobacterium sp. 28A TaxID=2735895 RepID=UPI00156E15BB|nr:hypothetical protein [Flavobacterium sp. 28A]NRT15271.1 cold shock CspA family protein [Flavobacterium sp. 28A]